MSKLHDIKERLGFKSRKDISPENLKAIAKMIHTGSRKKGIQSFLGFTFKNPEQSHWGT